MSAAKDTVQQFCELMVKRDRGGAAAVGGR